MPQKVEKTKNTAFIRQTVIKRKLKKSNNTKQGHFMRKSLKARGKKSV